LVKCETYVKPPATHRRFVEFRSTPISNPSVRLFLKNAALFLGSLGHWCANYEKARGYEINPYHPMAYKYIDNVSLEESEENNERVLYRMRSGAPGNRVYALFPQYYRYLPSQLEGSYARQVTRHKMIDVAVISTTQPILELPRAPPPVLTVLGPDIRFISCSIDLNQLHVGQFKNCDGVNYDVPGVDLFFSRYRRNLGNRPVLHRTYVGAKTERCNTDVWIVSSRHCDPVKVVEGIGTHYVFNLNCKPHGTFYRRLGIRYEVVAPVPSLVTSMGTVFGVRCMVPVPGEYYSCSQKKIKTWSITSHDDLGLDNFVCVERFLSLTAPRELRPPDLTLYEISDNCNRHCRWPFTNHRGDTIWMCSVRHTANFVIALDSIYHPIDFEKFKDIKFGDDIGDYYDTEATIAPIVFEEQDDI